jgi:hypothetical protein
MTKTLDALRRERKALRRFRRISVGEKLKFIGHSQIEIELKRETMVCSWPGSGKV